jgi:drug/metabolite transporter, DME family
LRYDGACRYERIALPETNTNDLIGVLVAITTALAWATSTIILKTVVARIDVFTLNTVRLWVGSLVLIMIIVVSGRGPAMALTPLMPLLLVAVSGIMAMAIGDTSFIKSLSLIDASKAFSIAQCSFPIMATIVAVAFLGEGFTWLIGLGAVLVVLGIYLIAAKDKRAPDLLHTPEATMPQGVLLALAAASAWTVATAFLKIGTLEMDPFVAAGIRIPIAATLMTLYTFGWRDGSAAKLRKYGPRSVALVAAAGLLTYGVAAVGYVTAIQMIGAARTVLITTTAPVFVLPFSILLLNERPSGHTLAGILFCVAGVVCVAF